MGNFERKGERGENKKTCQSNGEALWAEIEHVRVLHVYLISFEYRISCIYGPLDKTHTDIMRKCSFITAGVRVQALTVSPFGHTCLCQKVRSVK